MSVVNMRLISIIGFLNELDSVSSACVSLSAFEPDYVDKFFEGTEKFSPFVNEKDSVSIQSSLLSAAQKINKKIELSDCAPIMSKKHVLKYVSSFSDKCEKNLEKIKNLKDEIIKNVVKIENLGRFKSLRYKISRFKNLDYVSFKFLKISKLDCEKLDSMDENYDKFAFEIFSEDLENFYCFFFISKGFKEKFDKILEDTKFTEFDFSDLEFTPSQEMENLKIRNNQIELEIQKIQDGLEKFWIHQKNYCSRVYSCLKEYEKLEYIKSFAKVYNDNFIFVGWIPESKVGEISEKLDKISRIEYSIESGDEILKFSPPTKLKNKKIFSPFEFFVSTYGLPKYSEVDPTSFVAITYTIIFGIMFADVGQGLLLALVGFLLSRFKKISLGKIMTICGISSSIFGLIFGSVFGFEHALDFFYNSIGIKPIDVMNSAMNIIVSSIMIGIFCLVMAMCANIYSLVKKRNIKEAILSHSGLCGIVLYSSFVCLIVEKMYNLAFISPLLLVISISVSLILIFLKEAIKSSGKEIKWGGYILSQVFELFEIVLGYFTNTISFIRIGVFIFVHAGMMMVVFNLAKMSGSMYPLVVVLGNLFVTCFEALLVGMQVMRLQFCELFGRFFEGGGREFKPIINKIKKI